MSHADLIARLEAAPGPRLELDGMVWCAVNGYEYVQWDGAGCAYTDPNAPNWDQGIKHAQASVVRPYTASLDAAVGLVERVLPGWFWRVGRTSLFPKGWAYISKTHPSHCDREDEASCANGRAATPAIALLIATLKALEQ